MTEKRDLLAASSDGKTVPKQNQKRPAQDRTGGPMPNSSAAPGIVGPFAGLDVSWLLGMRADVRRDHPFLIWAPFDTPARKWSYGEFHDRVGALAAGLTRRGVRPGEFVLAQGASAKSSFFEALFAANDDREEKQEEPTCRTQLRG
jgi:hypothetical protein